MLAPRTDPAPPPAPPGVVAEIAKAVAIATLSAITAGFVEWGFERLKKRFEKEQP